MEEKISIIIPAYNTEHHIYKCVESVLMQNYRNIEVIIINDGSTDNTKFICEDLMRMDNRIKVINNENKGVSAARNIGIDYASGKYLVFVDSDDLVTSNIYTDMINKMDIDSMPICGYSYINSKKDIIGEKKAYIYDCILEKKDFFLLCENFILNSPVNKIFNLKIIKENNIRFNEELSLGEDLIFVLDYIKYIKKFVLINKPYYKYLVESNESLSTKYRSDLLNINIKLIEEIYMKFEEYDVEFELYKRRFFTRSLDLILQGLDNTMRKENDISYCEKFKYNNRVLKSSKFKKLINESDLSIVNIFTRIGFRINSYEFIYYSNRILRALKRR